MSVLGTPGIVEKLPELPRSIMSVLLVSVTLKSRRAIHAASHSGLYHPEADKRMIHKNVSYKCCCGRKVVGDRLTFLLIEALKMI